MQSDYNSAEPTVEELNRWKGSIKIQPQQDVKIPILFENLFNYKATALHSGVYIGSQSQQAKQNSQAFVTSNIEGQCEVYVNIYEDRFELSAGTKFFCYKRLTPIKPDY